MPAVETLARRGGVKLPNKALNEKLGDIAVKNSYGSTFGGILVGDLDRRTAISVSFLFGCSWLFVFAYLLWSMTTATMNQRYLSLEVDQDSICDEVPIAAVGTFEASYNGIWGTSSEFNHNTSFLELTFNAKKIKNSEYTAGMLRIQAQLAAMGRSAAQRNVLYNLMLWSSLAVVDIPTGMQLVSSADSGIIFQGQAYQAALSSAAGVCDARQTTGASLSSRFDLSSASMVMRVKLVTFNASMGASSAPTPRRRSPTTTTGGRPVGTRTRMVPLTTERRTARAQLQFVQFCPKQGLWTTPDYMQISPIISQFRNGYMDFQFDVRTTILCIALNLGVLSTSKFVRRDSRFGQAIGLVAYTDPWYTNPPMDPVYCIDKQLMQSLYGLSLDSRAMNGPEVCMLASSFGTRSLFYFYPMLQQFYNNGQVRLFNNFQLLSECICPSEERSCNLEKYFFSFWYDTKFSFLKTVAFALRNQRIITSQPQGDLVLSQDLANIVAYTVLIDGTRAFADRPIVSFYDAVLKAWQDRSSYRNQTLNQLLAAEWRRVWPGGAAFVFQLQRYPGQTDTISALNKYKVSLSDLASNRSSLKTSTFVFTIQYSVAAGRDAVPSSARTLVLPKVMCVDSFSRSAQGLGILAQKPPIPLVENYLQCHKTAAGAFLASVGGAAASASLYMSVAWAVCGMLYILYLKHNRPKKELIVTEDVRATIEAGMQGLKDEALFRIVGALYRRGQVRGDDEETAAAFDWFTRLYRPPTDDKEEEDGLEEESDCIAVGQTLSARLEAKANSASFSGRRNQARPRPSRSSVEYFDSPLRPGGNRHVTRQSLERRGSGSPQQRASLSGLAAVGPLSQLARHPLDSANPRSSSSQMKRLSFAQPRPAPDHNHL